MKKILVVDDSALMRRVLCDIINSDKRYHVEDTAFDGQDALRLLSSKSYDAMVLDVHMPKMNGLELLRELNKQKISIRVMMASTSTKEGAKITLDALDLGALDFIHKPTNAAECRTEDFQKRLLEVLTVVVNSRPPVVTKAFSIEDLKNTRKVVEIARKHTGAIAGNKIVCIASSTGGPKALQAVITRLPKDIKCPVVIVQHMPAGFTASLAERLNSLSEVTVSEAKDGDILERGHVYLAMGGKHLNIDMKAGGKYVIRYSDEPTREGVKPCANYMFESLMSSSLDEVICVVLTGMGADGTKGITALKEKKKVHVIAQEQSTCAVYGMPKAVVLAGLADQVVPLDQVAQEIILNAGVI